MIGVMSLLGEGKRGVESSQNWIRIKNYLDDIDKKRVRVNYPD